MAGGTQFGGSCFKAMRRILYYTVDLIICLILTAIF